MCNSLNLNLNKPVVILSGNEFLPKEGITFAQQILEFFQTQGGLAHSPWGDVLLDMKGNPVRQVTRYRPHQSSFVRCHKRCS